MTFAPLGALKKQKNEAEKEEEYLLLCSLDLFSNSLVKKKKKKNLYKEPTLKFQKGKLTFLRFYVSVWGISHIFVDI